MAIAKKSVKKTKLNKALNKNARAWVKALRSGKFKQTKGTLTRIDPDTGEIIGYCCLGVACELAVKAKLVKPQVTNFQFIHYDGKGAVLPDSVRAWLGMRDDSGSFLRGTKNLTSENDNGKSFKQIARIIEQKAAELFV